MRETAREKIVRTARVLRVVAWMGAVACVLITVIALLTPPNPTAQIAATVSGDGLSHGWAAAIVLVLAVITAAALLELASMLGQVREHALFASGAARHFRRFAGLLALAAGLRVLLPLLAAFAMTLQDAHKATRLTIDGADILALLLTAVFFLVARLFEEASRLEDDSHSIV